MSGLSVCAPCPLGQSSSSPGALSCTSCVAGKFAAQLGLQICTDCPVGSAQTRQGQSYCDLCGPGFYSSVPSAASCSRCAPGTFNPSSNQTVCAFCAVGTYQPGNSAVDCLNCAPGKGNRTNTANALAALPALTGRPLCSFLRHVPQRAGSICVRQLRSRYDTHPLRASCGVFACRAHCPSPASAVLFARHFHFFQRVYQLHLLPSRHESIAVGRRGLRRMLCGAILRSGGRFAVRTVRSGIGHTHRDRKAVERARRRRGRVAHGPAWAAAVCLYSSATLALRQRASSVPPAQRSCRRGAPHARRAPRAMWHASRGNCSVGSAAQASIAPPTAAPPASTVPWAPPSHCRARLRACHALSGMLCLLKDSCSAVHAPQDSMAMRQLPLHVCHARSDVSLTHRRHRTARCVYPVPSKQPPDNQRAPAARRESLPMSARLPHV